MTTYNDVLALVVALNTSLIFILAVRVRFLSERVASLRRRALPQAGTLLPEHRWAAVDSTPVSTRELRPLIVLLSASCGVCLQTVRDLAAGAGLAPQFVDVLLVGSPDQSTMPALADHAAAVGRVSVIPPHSPLITALRLIAFPIVLYQTNTTIHLASPNLGEVMRGIRSLSHDHEASDNGHTP